MPESTPALGTPSPSGEKGVEPEPAGSAEFEFGRGGSLTGFPAGPPILDRNKMTIEGAVAQVPRAAL